MDYDLIMYMSAHFTKMHAHLSNVLTCATHCNISCGLYLIIKPYITLLWWTSKFGNISLHCLLTSTSQDTLPRSKCIRPKSSIGQCHQFMPEKGASNPTSRLSNLKVARDYVHSIFPKQLAARCHVFCRGMKIADLNKAWRFESGSKWYLGIGKTIVPSSQSICVSMCTHSTASNWNRRLFNLLLFISYVHFWDT